MDEVLKARKLTDEILQRASAIQAHMQSVNASMRNMELMERHSSQQVPAAAAPRSCLMDLPDDCLAHVVAHVRHYTVLCTLACTCRRWQLLVYRDHKGWEARCRADWGIVEQSPQFAPRLDTGLLWAGTAALPPDTSPRRESHTDTDNAQSTALPAAGNTQQVQAASCSHTAMPCQPPSSSQPEPAQRHLNDSSASSRVSASGAGCMPGEPSSGVAWAEVWPEVVSPRNRQPSSSGAARSTTSPEVNGAADDVSVAGPANGPTSPVRQPLPLPRLFSLQSKANGWSSSTGCGLPGLHSSGKLNSPIKPTAHRRSSNGTSDDQDMSATVAPVSTAWRLIYRDRTQDSAGVQGWHLVQQTLTWLRDHGHPPGVTGSMHRFQLQLALRYIVLGTGQPHDTDRRKVVVDLGGLKSLLALLQNDAALVVEMAATVLANIMVYSPDTKLLVLVGSRLGKVFGERLDFSSGPLSGAMQACCRALVTLWVEPPTPEVCVLDAMNQIAHPRLLVGHACRWLLQEYTLRGESTSLIRLMLTFQRQQQSKWSFHGAGTDHSHEFPEEFDVVGTVGVCADGQHKWTWQRRCTATQHTLLYSGYSDAHGSYGVYTSQRPGSALALVLASTGRQPRTYRMYLDTGS